MIKRLKLLWRLSKEIEEIKDYPNGKVEIIFSDRAELWAGAIGKIFL